MSLWNWYLLNFAHLSFLFDCDLSQNLVLVLGAQIVQHLDTKAYDRNPGEPEHDIDLGKQLAGSLQIACPNTYTFARSTPMYHVYAERGETMSHLITCTTSEQAVAWASGYVRGKGLTSNSRTSVTVRRQNGTIINVVN